MNIIYDPSDGNFAARPSIYSSGAIPIFKPPTETRLVDTAKLIICASDETKDCKLIIAAKNVELDVGATIRELQGQVRMLLRFNYHNCIHEFLHIRSLTDIVCAYL